MREASYVFFASFLDRLKALHTPRNIVLRLRRLMQKLSTKENLRYAIKTGLAVVISYLIAIPVSENYYFWSPISAIIVMQVSVAASVDSSIDRIVGSLYGAILGLTLYVLLPVGPVLANSLALFVIAMACALLLLWNPRYRLAGIVSISVFLIGSQRPSVWIFALDFLLLIIISILVSVVISIFLWPVSGAEALRQSLKKQYLMAADYLDTITDAFLNEQSHLLPNYIDPLHDATSTNRSKYRQVREYEAINLSRHYGEVGVLVIGLEQIRVYISSLLDALDSEAEPIKELPMTKELMALSSSAASGLRWIASHSSDQQLPEVRWYIEATSIRIADLLREKELLELSQAQLVQTFAFYNAMNHLAETVANLEEQIEIISRKNYHYRTKKHHFKFLRRMHIRKLFKKQGKNDRV